MVEMGLRDGMRQSVRLERVLLAQKRGSPFD
jgi:hypothetical protein